MYNLKYSVLSTFLRLSALYSMFFRMSSHFSKINLKNVDKRLDFIVSVCYIVNGGGDNMAEGLSDTRSKIAGLLRKYREAAGLTARQVEELTGKSYKTVSAWENGRGQPDAEMFLRLCEIYNVPNVSVFFGQPLPEPVLEPKERELLTAWREATDSARESALMVLHCNKRPAIKKDVAI